MELKKFKTDLKNLKEGEKIVLGDYVFYLMDNEYHVFNIYKNIEDNVYKKKEILFILNDFRFTIERHSEKKLKSERGFARGEW